jgi:LAO/AO transport system kinase
MQRRELIPRARQGDRRALARIISIVEEGRAGAAELVADLFPSTGRAHVIGVTGAPGSGKSTLVDRMVAQIRTAGESVAVVAVDPSSPFTGGAILGDRIRMQDHIGDAGVYVRSMASRGHLGGMSAAAPKVIAVLDAVDFPWVIVETVGVGQAEVEVVGEADTTVVVVNPGWGDAVQANKAGLLEIADVFAVNKADRPGAPETVKDLRQMLELGSARDWDPPIVETIANRGDGSAELMAAVRAHRAHLGESDRLLETRRARLLATMRRAVADITVARMAGLDGVHSDLVDAVVTRSMDPWAAAADFVERG